VRVKEEGASDLVWDFETDAAYQLDLNWADDIARCEHALEKYADMLARHGRS
jgi:hypothetical protein